MVMALAAIFLDPMADYLPQDHEEPKAKLKWHRPSFGEIAPSAEVRALLNNKKEEAEKK